MIRILMVALCFLLSCKAEADPCPAPPSNDPGIPSLEPELKMLINKARSDRGLPILTTVAPLDCAASMHSRDMATTLRCSHTGSNGDQFWQRAKICGGVASGEIIACGFKTAESAMSVWLRSKPHYDIIMDSKNVAMGAKRVGDYWTIIFRK